MYLLPLKARLMDLICRYLPANQIPQGGTLRTLCLERSPAEPGEAGGESFSMSSGNAFTRNDGQTYEVKIIRGLTPARPFPPFDQP
jgi:hypothetical protein